MKRIAITMMSLGLLSANVYADTTQTPGQGTTTTTQMSGEEFLAANKNNPGVVTLPDGLQYKVIKEGTGPKPTDTDTVVVDYTGKFVNGTEFDSSYKHGKPVTFPVGGVIPGWTEALKLMKAGSTWQLFIPPHLAYGAAGSPPLIGANQTLIFEVHLIEVKK